MSTDPNAAIYSISYIEKTIFFGLLFIGLAFLFAAGFIVLTAYLTG